ncbi:MULTISPECIES: transglycosylase family protein [Protofrankia]|uniref:Transglycosylase-like domain protein n=1 Tax=Candidatus Protofrankia datiscae TaxID=2716812 RepID=F8AV77_9ACTN|nr:Transglycosylase-like domain protein [Candidatus Protofrankia datiscae]
MSHARARHRKTRQTTSYTRALVAIPTLAAAIGGAGIGLSGPASAAPPEDQILSAIVQCESGGNPTVVNSIGAGGLFQFLPSTWQATGGTGLPQNASVAEQWKRARILYAQQGTAPWNASRSCWGGKVGSATDTAPTATGPQQANAQEQPTSPAGNEGENTTGDAPQDAGGVPPPSFAADRNWRSYRSPWYQDIDPASD